MQCLIASASSARGTRRLIGMSLERRASFGACSEKASRTEGSACSSVWTCSASPDVETVTCDTGTASPAGSTSTRIAWTTASTLSSGSPMPMKITLATCSPNTCAASATCATISAADRLRSSPIRPVSQKEHPIRHPTCDETQSDHDLPPGAGIATISTSSPPPQHSTYFSVSPSAGGAGGAPPPQANESGAVGSHRPCSAAPSSPAARSSGSEATARSRLPAEQ
mmetsp:Transcript_43646/g.142050  ORF Transcript_43646/g.142050 Transcript_43646/m.142050 type:complete len:225 (+) Transcript_43646:479-1153(+)